MEYDRYIGVNRSAERMAWKIVGGFLAFFFTLFVSGILNVFN